VHFRHISLNTDELYGDVQLVRLLNSRRMSGEDRYLIFSNYHSLWNYKIGKFRCPPVKYDGKTLHSQHLTLLSYLPR